MLENKPCLEVAYLPVDVKVEPSGALKVEDFVLDAEVILGADPGGPNSGGVPGGGTGELVVLNAWHFFSQPSHRISWYQE